MQWHLFRNLNHCNKLCPGGEIGRHAGLKILFAEKASAGSSPAWGTIYYRSLTYKETHIMETLSFILGIALVVVIALAIVAVYAFVKVGKLENQIRDFDNREQGIYRALSDQADWISKRIDETERNINDLGKEVFSQLDSRLDKLENKLINNKK